MSWWVEMSRYGRPYRGETAIVILLTLAGAFLDALKPWPLKLIVDHVLSDQPFPAAVAWITTLTGGASAAELLLWLTVSTVLLFLASWVSRMARSYVQSGLGRRMAYDLAADVFSHLQRLSLRYHGRRQVGDLAKRVTGDSHCVEQLVTGVFVPLVTSLGSLVMMFLVMWQLDRTLSLLALLVVPPLLLSMRLLAKPMTEREYEQLQLQGEMMALAEQTLTAIPIVQAFGREQHEDRRFATVTSRTGRAFLRATKSQLLFKVTTTSATAFGTAVIMGVGGFHVLGGTLTVGSLLVFLSYLTSLYGPLEALAYLSSGFAAAAAGARRISEVLVVDDRVQDLPGARPLQAPNSGKHGHVQIQDVTFGYAPSDPVLHSVSLEAYPGEVVALVGPTGAGKSTLISLIPRLFDPWAGRVLFDGCDVRHVQLRSLRSQIAIVLQDPFLLPLTVAENIAYGRHGATREEIESAVRAANADEFVRRLPHGYDTILGERGATLSGGERQRLAIARALLRDAPVLILDEPTSALDAETESVVLDAVERLMKGRTAFLIAHRLSTIRRASRIVVLQHGKVVEAGSRDELLATPGVYHRLHQLHLESATAATR